MRERHLYIPPDVDIAASGQPTTFSDWQYILRFNDNHFKGLMSFTGMGMPQITYITQSGPNQPGETILSFNLEPRYIQYVIAQGGACSRMTWWDNRERLGTLLSPARQTPTATQYETGRLRVIRPDGSMRDIDAVIQDGPKFEPRDPGVWNEWNYIETLRFKCPDPTWYNPVRVDTTWTLTVYEGLIFYEATDYPNNLTFPDNAIFGTDVITAGTGVVYTGTWFGYPTIYITGPMYAPCVENQTLGQKIALNYNVAIGEVITINTTYGRKSITNNFGDNLMGTLTKDSSMEFFLAHHPWATGGVNVLQCSGSGSTAATEVRFTYYTRYITI